MRITNNHNLPAPLYAAASGYISRPRPLTGENPRISVTDLIGPPQIRALKLKHFDKMEEDAADRIWAVFGTAVHSILEKYAKDQNVLAEEWLTAPIMGVEIRGVADLYSGLDQLGLDSGTLYDYKIVGWMSLKDGVKDDHTAQLNTYAGILRRSGMPVEQLRIVALIRDWTRSKVGREPGYPARPVIVQEIPVWSQRYVKEYLERRVALHMQAEIDGNVECTDEERWATNESWAVYKAGSKRALRVLASREDAIAWQRQYDENQIAKLPKKKPAKPPRTEIQHRSATNRRCEDFCPVSRWCPQYDRIKKIAALSAPPSGSALVDLFADDEEDEKV